MVYRFYFTLPPLITLLWLGEQKAVWNQEAHESNVCRELSTMDQPTLPSCVPDSGHIHFFLPFWYYSHLKWVSPSAILNHSSGFISNTNYAIKPFLNPFLASWLSSSFNPYHLHFACLALCCLNPQITSTAEGVPCSQISTIWHRGQRTLNLKHRFWEYYVKTTDLFY